MEGIVCRTVRLMRYENAVCSYVQISEKVRRYNYKRMFQSEEREYFYYLWTCYILDDNRATKWKCFRDNVVQNLCSKNSEVISAQEELKFHVR